MTSGVNRSFEGFLYRDIPKELSFSGKPETNEQWYELSQSQARQINSSMIGIPIYHEHDTDDQPIGKVIQSDFVVSASNGRGIDWKVAFELDTSKSVAARTAAALIDIGSLRELSLSHISGQFKPLEVTVCTAGAREGTNIVKGFKAEHELNLSPQEKDYLKSLCVSASKRSRSTTGAVIVSATKSGVEGISSLSFDRSLNSKIVVATKGFLLPTIDNSNKMESNGQIATNAPNPPIASTSSSAVLPPTTTNNNNPNIPVDEKNGGITPLTSLPSPVSNQSTPPSAEPNVVKAARAVYIDGMENQDTSFGSPPAVDQAINQLASIAGGNIMSALERNKNSQGTTTFDALAPPQQMNPQYQQQYYHHMQQQQQQQQLSHLPSPPPPPPPVQHGNGKQGAPQSLVDMSLSALNEFTTSHEDPEVKQLSKLSADTIQQLQERIRVLGGELSEAKTREADLKASNKILERTQNVTRASNPELANDLEQKMKSGQFQHAFNQAAVPPQQQPPRMTGARRALATWQNATDTNIRQQNNTLSGMALPQKSAEEIRDTARRLAPPTQQQQQQPVNNNNDQYQRQVNVNASLPYPSLPLSSSSSSAMYNPYAPPPGPYYQQQQPYPPHMYPPPPYPYYQPYPQYGMPPPVPPPQQQVAASKPGIPLSQYDNIPLVSGSPPQSQHTSSSSSLSSSSPLPPIESKHHEGSDGGGDDHVNASSSSSKPFNWPMVQEYYTVLNDKDSLEETKVQASASVINGSTPSCTPNGVQLQRWDGINPYYPTVWMGSPFTAPGHYGNPPHPLVDSERLVSAFKGTAFGEGRYDPIMGPIGERESNALRNDSIAMAYADSHTNRWNLTDLENIGSSSKRELRKQIVQASGWVTNQRAVDALGIPNDSAFNETASINLPPRKAFHRGISKTLVDMFCAGQRTVDLSAVDVYPDKVMSPFNPAFAKETPEAVTARVRHYNERRLRDNPY